MEKIGNGPIVGESVSEYLNDRRYQDYYEYKERLLRWLHKVGKNPDRTVGYADSTVANVSYRIDLFHLWNWEETGTYGTKLTVDRADAFMMHLVVNEDYSNTYMDIMQKCFKRVFKYQNHVEGENVEWEPEHTFPQDLSAPRDFLTMEERQKVRDAALDYGTVPSYQSVTPEGRDKWKTYLSQRFEKPKEDVCSWIA